MKQYDYVIVGAGLFGSVLAERIATLLNASVLMVEKRPHIGGNCYSCYDEETGVEYHKYGTHIFHTNDRLVWDYINKFTEFNGYHHQVLTKYRGTIFQMPINLETINSYYGLSLTPAEARLFIEEERKKENIVSPANLEEKAISQIGRPLYEAFIKGYTVKQWKKDPRELPADIINRLPVRFDYCEDYFVNSRWQGIPTDGYTKIFERLHASPNITVELNCDYFEMRDELKPKKKLIYSGHIDRLFDYQFGALEWRSVRFEREVHPVQDFQGTSVLNYADLDVPFTRIHEPRHLHPERTYSDEKTLIFYEYPNDDSTEFFYPITSPRNMELNSKYAELAAQDKGLLLGGRLGKYRYYDMDQTILSALNCFDQLVS